MVFYDVYDTGFVVGVKVFVWKQSDSVEFGDDSFVESGEFVGRMVLHSDDIEFSNEEVLELLELAVNYRRNGFIKRFMEIHNESSGCLDEFGIDDDEFWIREPIKTTICRVESGYLEENIVGLDGGEEIVDEILEDDTFVDAY